MVCYAHLIKNFPSFVVSHTFKGFGIVNKAEIDVFLKLSCFFDDPALDSLNWSLDGAMLLTGKNVVPGAMR